MAQTPRIAALKEADLLIPDGDVKGEQMRQVFRRLFAQLNPFFDQITKMSGSISLADNDHADLITSSFTHGVPSALRLQKISTARSAIVRACSGATPVGAPLVQMQPSAFPGAPAVALVTLYFTNPSAAGVKAMVELREEGLSLASAPLIDGVRANYFANAAQSVANSVDQAVNFDSVIADTDSAVTTGAAWHFTVPPNKTGLYLCSAGATLLTPSTATAINNYRLKVRRNGTVAAVLMGEQVPAVSSAFAAISGSAPIFANAGDTIDFVLFQDTAAAISTASDAQLSRGTWCSIVRLLGY